MGDFLAKSSMAYITVSSVLSRGRLKSVQWLEKVLSWRRLHVEKFSGIHETSVGRGGRQT